MDAVILAGPCEPKHRDWEQNAADHRHRQAILRSVLVALLRLLPVPIRVVKDVCTSDASAYHGSDKRELADAGVPAAFLLEDDRVDAEEHVEQAVDDGHVNGGSERDRVEEDDPGSGKRHFEDADERAVRGFDWGEDILVAWDFGATHALGFV